MGLNKIDRLFEERLRNYEVGPSEDAWSHLKGRIGKKQGRSKGGYWLVAASFSLIMSCYWLFLGKDGQEGEVGPYASDVLYPDTPSMFDWEQEKWVITQAAGENGLTTKSGSDVNTVNRHFEERILMEPLIIKSKGLEATVAKIDLPSVAPEALSTLKKESVSAKIKITYIATQQKPLETTNDPGPNTFKRLLSFAGKITSGEVLADIKDAKDSFLSNRVRSDKDRSSL